jgi:GTP-binding protein
MVDAKQYQRAARATLKFVPYAPLIFAAAKTRYHVGPILDESLKIYDIRQVRVPTPKLNDVVRDAVQRHHPPFIQGRQLKLYYATQANVNPPTFVFFVNDPSLRHFSYERYLENQLREAFGFEGTTVRLQFRARTTDRDEDQEGAGRERKRRTTGERRSGGARR